MSKWVQQELLWKKWFLFLVELLIKLIKLYLGISFGQGVYFALNSSYSAGYIRSVSGYKKMFRCKVLVGSCTVGNHSMKVPPNKSNSEQYDSTGDNGGSIFVCYHDNQCYPEYLISFN